MIALLALATLAGDYFLHLLNLVWIGRYLGILGILIIIGSLSYSLRKRNIIAIGNTKTFLTMHQYGGWFGSWLVLLHSGVHFNALLPWLATGAMAVNVISGLVGKFLLASSRQHVQGEKTLLEQQKLTSVEIKDRLAKDTFILKVIAKWRKVHIPIFIAFAALASGHIISIFLFWGWK